MTPTNTSRSASISHQYLLGKLSERFTCVVIAHGFASASQTNE
jgi:hypothetical protein